MNGEKKNLGMFRGIFIWLLIVMMVILLINLISTPKKTENEIKFSEFIAKVEAGEVAEVTIQEKEVSGRFVDGKRFKTYSADYPDLVGMLKDKNVEITALPPKGPAWYEYFLSWGLPLIIIIAIWIFFMRQMQAGGTKAMSFGKSRARMITEKQVKITFKDVAGIEEAKEEVQEIIEFLRDPKKFTSLGGRIPKGVLLVGAPGTGKTLLGRAIAGEANVPFFSISGSDFVEMFVGVGASRVRDLFDQAKKTAPCIVFIDEIDAVGRHRGAGLGGGHDEREQTLNQILAEMDGFSPHQDVLVLAATNRPDVLDPALLRPGRFDRHVTLDLPDLGDRQAILAVHTRKIPLAADVDLAKLAAGTPGFSGADLKNLINEAAILAARDNQKTVTMQHCDQARDKVMMGTERTLAIEPDERHRLAVHESGHTLVAHFLPHADPLYKVSIIPRGHALGATQQLPEHERHTLPEDYLRDRLAVILGGRTAEKVLLGTVSSGADDDIHQATAMARAMVSRWGMSDEVGPVDLRESEEHPFLGREIAQPRHYSEHSAETVDHAVQQLLLAAEQTATETVEQHRAELEQLAALLEERETLAREDIEQCLGPAAPKKPLSSVQR
jgi:cell division protease FtsH